MKIPAGEHIPLDYARVLVAAKTSTLAGGVLSSPFCNAETGSTPSATITNVAGATATSGTLTGQGYTITGTDAGYGYSYGYGLSFGSHTETFGGYGYGYGAASADITVEITVKVTGCSFFIGGVTGATSAASETFRAQLFVGSSASNVIPSFPLTVVFANSNFVSTGPGTVQADASGVTVVDGPLPVNVLSAVSNLAAGSGVKSLALKPLGTDLAVGSRVAIVKDDDVDRNAPRFGVPNLFGQFPNGKPHMQFQVVLTKPNGASTTDLNGITEVHTVIQVPRSYFQALVNEFVFADEQQAVDNFKVFGYTNTGLKPIGSHPVVTRSGTSTDPYEFSIVIKHYSSFTAGSTEVVVPVGGGGGGGGGAVEPPPVPVTPPVTPPVPPAEPPVVPATPIEEPIQEEHTTSKKKTPGPGLMLLVPALAGAALLVRRRQD